MRPEDLILVSGATGNTGSALLQHLEKHGAVVRAMVRSSKDARRLPNTRPRQSWATSTIPPSLEAALEGVTRAYLVTPSEIASALSKAIGRPVTFIDVPPDAFAGALKSAGVPSWQVDGLVEDYAHYARGEAQAISPDVRDVTGVDPRDVGRFAEDHASAFIGT